MVFRLLSIGLLLVLGLVGFGVFMIGFAGDALIGPKREMARRHQHSVGNWCPLGAIVRTDLRGRYDSVQRGRPLAAPVGVVVDWGHGYHGFFVVLTFTFSWFIDRLASYNSLYGSLGTLLITLLWLNSNSSILLLGFELNAAINRARMDAEKQLETLHHETRIDPRLDPVCRCCFAQNPVLGNGRPSTTRQAASKA